MFFGAVIGPSELLPIRHDVAEVFHLSGACLQNPSSGTRNYLIVRKDGKDHTLCVLKKDLTENVMLDLFLATRDNITLKVQGDQKIHIYGYFEPVEEEELSSYGEENDEDDDEEDDEDDEDVKIEDGNSSSLKSQESTFNNQDDSDNGDGKNQSLKKKDSDSDSDDEEDGDDEIRGEKGEEEEEDSDEDSDEDDEDEDSDDEEMNQKLQELSKKMSVKLSKKDKKQTVKNEIIVDKNDKKRKATQPVAKGKPGKVIKFDKTGVESQFEKSIVDYLKKTWKISSISNSFRMSQAQRL